jgi:hypothetical protein
MQIFEKTPALTCCKDKNDEKHFDDDERDGYDCYDDRDLPVAVIAALISSIEGGCSAQSSKTHHTTIAAANMR